MPGIVEVKNQLVRAPNWTEHRRNIIAADTFPLGGPWPKQLGIDGSGCRWGVVRFRFAVGAAANTTLTILFYDDVDQTFHFDWTTIGTVFNPPNLGPGMFTFNLLGRIFLVAVTTHPGGGRSIDIDVAGFGMWPEVA